MDDSIATAIERNFGFDVIECEDCGLGQGQTRRFKVKAKGDRYVAKLLGHAATDQRFECSLLQFLGESGIPVAKNIPTSSGEPFAHFEGRTLVLYEWADGGVSWPAPPNLASALGSAIGRMHLASDSFDSTSSAPVYDLDRLIHRPLRLMEPFSPDKPLFRRLVEHFGEVAALVEQVPTSSPCFGPIHGDIHQGNCHFTESGDLTLIDFSLCGTGYRAYDLTGFLWPMRDQTIEDPKMADCCQAFLIGYESVRPLAESERLAIPAFVQVRTLWESGDWLDTGTGRDDPDQAAKIVPYIVNQLDRWKSLNP